MLLTLFIVLLVVGVFKLQIFVMMGRIDRHCLVNLPLKPKRNCDKQHSINN